MLCFSSEHQPLTTQTMLALHRVQGVGRDYRALLPKIQSSQRLQTKQSSGEAKTVFVPRTSGMLIAMAGSLQE